jgi:branched-chain amino acid transport system substrate-binding protein
MLATTMLAGAAHAQLSNDQIKIGVLNDQSGLYTDLGGPGSVLAARMAVEDNGGALADKVVIISADHQNKPDVGASIAREWYDVDGVDVIVDVPTSSVALAVQEVTREKKKLFLMSGPATARLTGENCSPYGIHWTYDTYSLAVGTGRAMVQEGGDTWFFLTADYAFGHSLESDTSNVVKAMGGTVVGEVRHPLSSTDFSSYLLQAQASGAKVIGLANAGGDTTNSIKQANEFGIVQGGQKLAALLMFLTDVHALGLDVAQGLVMTTGFYWDHDDESRAWSERFNERHGAMPTMVQAGVYSAVSHYLKAINATGTDTSETVIAKMEEMPVNDMFARNGKIRADHRMVHDMYLAEVKQPSESSGPWDYLKILRTIPGDEAFLPLSESTCAMVKQ